MTGTFARKRGVQSETPGYKEEFSKKRQKGYQGHPAHKIQDCPPEGCTCKTKADECRKTHSGTTSGKKINIPIAAAYTKESSGIAQNSR